MSYNIILPNQVWQGFDIAKVNFNPVMTSESLDNSICQKTFCITALEEDDDALRVVVKTYSQGENQPILLIVPEYHKMPSENLIIDLAESGFTVVVADIAGNDNPKTEFPERYSYGNYANSGDHLIKVIETPQNTCQYLYSVIIKRVMLFVKSEFKTETLILVGLGDAVEVAMQVAGSNFGKPTALACINSGGYREYIKLNKYGGGKELIMDEERICWLSGVASVAYAKYITCPSLIAIGTNSERSDIDRVNNLDALLPENNLNIIFSPKAQDFMLPESYQSFKIWLKHMAENKPFPINPTVELKVNSEGKIYAYVKLDDEPGLNVSKLEVFASYGEYNHEIRNWSLTEGIAVSQNEYLATIEVDDAEAPLFTFARVKYENGIVLTSLVEYMELKGQSVKKAPAKKPSRIVYQPEDGIDGFIECAKDEVLMEKGLQIVTAPCGAKGLKAKNGCLKTYQIDIQTPITDSSLLQVEFFSQQEIDINIYLQEKSDDEIKRYHVSVHIGDTKGFFIGEKFKLSDFKDSKFLPLDTWDNICSLEIEASGVIIGNILFI